MGSIEHVHLGDRYFHCLGFLLGSLPLNPTYTGLFFYEQDLPRQTLQTRFLLDIYVLKTMIYFLERVKA
jgi:hypothetical protein